MNDPGLEEEILDIHCFSQYENLEYPKELPGNIFKTLKGALST